MIGLIKICFCGLIAACLLAALSSCVYHPAAEKPENTGYVRTDLNIQLIGVDAVTVFSGLLTCISPDIPVPDDAEGAMRIRFSPEQVKENFYFSTLTLREKYLEKTDEGQILLSFTLELPDGSAATAWKDLTGRLCDIYRESGSNHLVLELEVERLASFDLVIRFTGWQTGNNGGAIINP